MTPRRQLLDWERRWATPAALAGFGAVFFVIAAILVASLVIGHGSGDSEVLRNVQEHRGAEMISSILQAIGVGLLAAPLYYLFRAASGRSDRMRGQLVGVVIAAPLFLAVLAILSGVSTLHAASDFVSTEVPRLTAKGVSLSSDHADEIAKETIDDAPLRALAAGFGLAGQLGFVVAMVYTCLYAMRVGLLTRFWGSLGIALGAVSFVFFQFTLLWFIYLGLLLLARVPGGRPPAWESGESIPWPTPGDRAAADMAAPLEHDQLTPPAEEEQLTSPPEDNQLTPPPEDPEASAPAEKGQSQ
jgi:MFS family permease